MTDHPGTIDAVPVLPIVRVAILADSRIVDMALPAQLPLREILPAVRDLLPAEDVPRALSLAAIGGSPFSLDASLETVGVVDGDLLALQPVPAGPPAPGIVEDIADAAVIFSPSRQRPWGIGDIRSMARAAVVMVILAATMLAAVYRVRTGSVTGLYALAAVAAATVIATLIARARAGRCAAEFSVVTLAPVGTALALAVGGDCAAPPVMLAAAGITAWSVICMIVADRGIAFFTGVTVIGVAILAAAAVAQIWQLPVFTLGCGLLATALLVTVRTPQLAAAAARLPLPAIPAPGDPAPTAPALVVLEDLPRRVRLGEAHQLGLLAGAVLLSVAGSLAVLYRPDTVGGWAWFAVVASSVGAVLRARVWDSAPCKAWLLGQPLLVSVAVLVSFVITGHHLGALCALAMMAVLTIAFVVVASNPKWAAPESYSLPVRRLTGMLAAVLDASLLPVLAYLVGLFGWVLER